MSVSKEGNVEPSTSPLATRRDAKFVADALKTLADVVHLQKRTRLVKRSFIYANLVNFEVYLEVPVS